MAIDIDTQGNGHSAASAIGPMADEAAQMAEQARQALEQAQEQVATFIRERPLVCLAGALALGYVVGKIVSR
jgi:ElaB/YqjD/DUF883 family membrane-anchored ribosome-binding protein